MPTLCFDRTYEGLKQFHPQNEVLTVVQSFDRTYEGLKRQAC